MQYVIAIVIIAIILYWTWEILLMLFLLYGIEIIAKSIYKSSSTHAVLYMYLWIVYGGFAFLLLCLPITHVRWFKGERTWLEKLYNTEYLSKIEEDCNKYIAFILENQLNECKIHPSSTIYNLYNRIASQDAENLYLDFRVGMLAKTFYDMNKNEYDNDYYRYSYMYPEVYDNKFKKYELLDGVNFILDGIFVRKRLQGIVLRDSESSSEDGCFKAEKLSKTIRKKFGDPIETSKDSANYIAKWLFDDKHIIVASIREFNGNGGDDTYYSYYNESQRFTGIIIYNPHSVIPLIEEERLARREAARVAKEQKKKKQEQARKALLKQQEEQKAIRQKEITDSILQQKRKNDIQNGF